MPTYAFMTPILPETTEAWRQWEQELMSTRRAEFLDSRKRAGITRERVFLQHTPRGDFQVAVWACEDPAKALRGLDLENPFDAWFASQLERFHGIRVSGSGPVPVNPKTLDTGEIP